MKLISVKEASLLLDVKERTVQSRIQKGLYQNRYIPGVGQGGKQLQIALESLPEEAQKKYWDRLYAARHAEYF